MVNIQKGDILLYESYQDRFISNIISKLTNSKYTHISMACTDSLEMSIDYNTTAKLRPINFEDRSFLILRPQVDDKVLENVIGDILLKDNSEYDYLKIVGLAIKLIFRLDIVHLFNIKNRLICTELLIVPFEKNGVSLFDSEQVESVVPADFLHSPILKVAGEFKLK
jgi:hypothetical protein